MTNKEFLEKISQKTHLEMDDVKELSSSLVGAVLEGIADGNSVTIQGRSSLVRKPVAESTTPPLRLILWCRRRLRSVTR